MRSVGVIPARIGSIRLPSKPLINIGGQCLLEWVIQAVKQKTELDDLLVATDDQRIADVAERQGVRAVLTDPGLTSGTDRVFAAIAKEPYDIVFNIQGDEPLVNPAWIDSLLNEFIRNPDLQMGTVATDLPAEDLGQLSAVKVILDQNKDAIYFSRLGIPYTRVSMIEKPGLALKHIGLYGYRKSFLKQFCDRSPTEIERAESLEQLRAMYMGVRIRVLKVQGESIGIDTPEDVAKLESILKARR